MANTMPIIEARSKLTSLPERLQREPEAGALAVTRRGRPVLAVMSWELYESIVETLEILGDEKMMAVLRQGIQEAAAGKHIPWEKAKRKLGL
ncbi:MAG: type II toxin-antitoxin system Phd/YefM family antitoxin [Acidobacteria bacterium]|nr:type II toxin-antitoxin system Phd/YefM family antitoxin [Acidobacteriota bacterium]